MSGHVFRIEILNNPSLAFFAGQIIEGRVLLQIGTEKKTGGIKLKCLGEAKVHFTETHTVSSGSGRNRTSRTETRHYRATEQYFEYKTYFVGGQNMPEQTIPPGTYYYPFRFQIPVSVPSSFQGRHGHIQYSLEATVKRSWKFDYNACVPFTVNSIVDLNTQPSLIQPVMLQKEKFLCCLCCKSGPITFTFRMDRSGFVPGQPLDFLMEVDNKSTTNLTCMYIKVDQNIRFRAQGHSKSVSTTVMHLRGPAIPAGETEVWRGTARIPPLPPTGLGGCHIIELYYDLRPILDIPGAFDLKGNFPVTIGTIPLREQFNHFTSVEPWPGPPAPFHEPTGGAADATPSAPPLISGYPDLPPPSYELATKFDNNLPDYDHATINDTGDGGDQGGGGSSAPTFDPNFVPKYPTYGWSS